ncbi:amidohydrolase [Variovorax sp. M-6]|uniref:amidohydrolase n=1 Tax=Variovorax sp. M-6 TaxID=3233041 RepID=UPI003F94A696
MKSLIVVFLASGAAAASAQSPAKPAAADAIWFNGPVVTIDDARPGAEAVAVKDGRIVQVGARDEVMRRKGAGTRMVDLKGATLLPGFVDPHGHVSMVGFQALSANLLPPPDGAGDSIESLQTTLADFRRQSLFASKFGLLFGFGYDDSQLKEQRHPTRDDLDKVASDIPVIAVHQSSHFGAFNSKALELVGVSAESKNPDGGVIRRKAGSQEPDGVLEENAFFEALVKLMPKLSEAEAIMMLVEGQKLYTSFGYTTIQDGRSDAGQIKIAQAAARQGKLVADIVAYPDILVPGTEAALRAPWFRPTPQVPVYTGHFRIGGVKLTLDGSPQGKTAWLSQPYFKPPPGKDASYAGYGVVKDEEVVSVVRKSLAHRWQLLTHANGDRAIDQLIASARTAEQAEPGIAVRMVLIHGQTLRKDQIPELKALKIIPSLFPMHTYYWGDWYRSSVLGPDRAPNISPTMWVRDAGMIFTTHHDAPVANPDSIRVLAATVNRTTRTGYVLGPDQRVDPLTALKAMTLWPAYQYFEEKSKGSITPGKLADFVVLSRNPMTVPRESLGDLKVLSTVKEGKTIYSRP